MTARSRKIVHHETFRATLLALAYPGRRFQFGLPTARDRELPEALLAEAVYEAATKTWTNDPALEHLGSPTKLEEAAVLFVRGPSSDGAIGRARRGSEESPSGGATVVLGGRDLQTKAHLSGPGVNGSLEAYIALSEAELADREVACGFVPLGIDLLWLAVRDGIADVVGLPRTTKVEVG